MKFAAAVALFLVLFGYPASYSKPVKLNVCGPCYADVLYCNRNPDCRYECGIEDCFRAQHAGTLTFVTDIAVITGTESNVQPQPGYTKIDVDLNENAGGLYIYLTYKLGDEADAITGLQIASGYSSSFPAPPGYTQLEQDLTEGAGPRYIYLYTTKSESLPPIKEIQVMSGPSSNVWPDDPAWVRINTDTNEGAGGDYVYVSYRYN